MNKAVETIEEGCPICGGDVKGNDRYRFFCKRCNVLYDRKHLARKRVEEKPPQAEREKPLTLPPGVKYIASNHSDKYHRLGCRYVDQIKAGGNGLGVRVCLG